MTRIFISYSRIDKPFVEELIPLILEVYLNHAIWYDSKIIGGEDWWKRIIKEIGNCDLFICIISNEYLVSINCQKEFREALRLRKSFLPISLIREPNFDTAPA